ncbi:MAG: PilN domain-containing protein, partial [Verrucomicrobia bacterium]|nr:PilN domain-containing protein [Verrucomicrobiota bacterium]
GGRVIEGEKDLGDLVKRHHDVIVAVPAAYCSTFSQMLPTQDESLFEDMVFAQIEKRGLAEAAGRRVPFDFHVVEKNEGRTLLSVDVLSTDLPEHWCLAAAAAYFPSARLLNSPVESDIIIWREHGRLTMVVSVHGRITGTIQLSASEQVDAALAQEVNLLSLSFQADGSVGENPRLVLLGDFSQDDRAEFEKSLVMAAEYHQVPGPRLEADAADHMEELLPLPVKDGRKRKQRANKRNAVLMAVFVLYVAIGAGFWIYAQRTKQNIESLEQQVEVNRPEVRKIEEAARRWQELTPAFDLKRYPLVQLNEVTRLMPPTGVLIREFETKGTTVRIHGQARDAQIAFQFEEDLESSDFLKQYQWNMPQPKVNKNNTATFEIHGELNYAKSE